MHTYPKKCLGQHFLVDKNIRAKILKSCHFKNSDVVLEIGAGRGEMASLIAPKVKHLLCIEIDKNLYQELKAQLKRFKNVELICADILKVDISRRIKEGHIKVFGNIPYYLTTPIITYLIRYRRKIDKIFLTVQKEFAKRIVALPGSRDYSAFSIYCNYYLTSRTLFFISRGCFYPVPKVDSAFLEMQTLSRPSYRVGNESFFFKVVRTAFGQRRKTLKNALKGLVDPLRLSSILTERGIKPSVRAEELSCADFAYLSRRLLHK